MWYRVFLVFSLFLLPSHPGCTSGSGRGGDLPRPGTDSPSGPVSGPESPKGGPGKVFEGISPLAFTLEADFHRLRKDRDQESGERPGRLRLAPLHGGESFPVEIRTRGNFRLQPSICELPPLRLDLPTDSLRGSALEGLNKVKMVTHCRDRDSYEQNLLEEFLAYQILGLLTPVSFRTQLAVVTYRDTSGEESPISRLAFLIESEDALAARLQAESLEVPRASPHNFKPEQAGLLYLFQFLIGNTDWSVVHFHNVKLIRQDRDYLPVPYDFDFSGLVYAPYASPSPRLAPWIDSVRDRLYIGHCSEQIDHSALFALFRERREAILDLVRSVPGLSEENIRSADRYIGDFFSIIDNPELARRRILKACR